MITIDTERFIKAQDSYDSYMSALEEIKRGQKQSHWIWYVFPQIEGLGHSTMAKKYAIRSLQEAKAYLGNDKLNARLREITRALLEHAGDKDITHIMGHIDAMKVRSCMTLFDIVSPHDIFEEVLDKFYDGERCKATLNIVREEKDVNRGDNIFTRIGHNLRGFCGATTEEAVISKPQLPKHLRPKVYGQTRTMVDMLIAMNKEAHFTSAQEALTSLFGHLDRLAEGGDEIAFNCSWRSINAFAGECFENGKLNVDKLQEACTHHFDDALSDVYAQYVAEKTAVLVSYMNEFRRYTNPQDILNDFLRATGGVNHCGPNPDDYYFAFNDYVQSSFSDYLSRFWDEISTDGVLDNAKFRDFMIERHERGIKKYGLENVIKRNFKEVCPCHPEVLVAYRGGAAPIYVWRYRGYIKSCMEGRNIEGIPGRFEFGLIEPLLREDPKYTHYIPKEDFTLPVYDYWRGRMHFESEEDKLAFIKKQLGHA